MKKNSEIARKRITYLWFIGSGVIVTLIVIQQLNGKFEDKTSEGWLWISANLMPTIGLISSGLVSRVKTLKPSNINKLYFNICFYPSLFYLLLMVGIIFLYPFTDYPVIEYYHQSNIFLIPLQAVIGCLIGIFFNKGNENTG